ncbi:acyl carrier protein [Actinomadura rupiterrae]|uniref:acyl carrier protein n=1 Tax=Actinomadura rupiterrae TaxID=559627 RepID=UPI0020A2AD3D|nr:acyl carrier protein [Actinomadura rupiterrae]MCP2341716.1 acyl carrier protein [Actinomadura rupiterrae]
MDAADTVETVIEIIEEVLGEMPGELSPDDVLAARKWDSIASLEALAQLEGRFGVNLDLRRFHAARTAAEMADLVAEGLAVRTGGA